MNLASADRARLERLISDPDSPAKHVYRARIVLLACEGLGSTRIARAVGRSEPTVRRWLTRFGAAGLEALLQEATRPPGRKPLPIDTVERVVHMTLHALPPDATCWSARRLAKTVGIGHGAVQKIWAMRGLKPHLTVPAARALARDDAMPEAARPCLLPPAQLPVDLPGAHGPCTCVGEILVSMGAGTDPGIMAAADKALDKD